MANDRPGTTPGPDVSDYRLAPLVVARFVGLSLVVLALLMFLGTALVITLELPGDLLVALLVAGVVGVFVLAWWLRSRAYVVRLDSEGYRVRMIRGAGVRQASWKDVADAATAAPRGIACVVLRLVDDRTTTIPVEVLVADREAFVRDLQEHLQRGQGLRSL
jgi:hypothetical protein